MHIVRELSFVNFISEKGGNAERKQPIIPSNKQVWPDLRTHYNASSGQQCQRVVRKSNNVHPPVDFEGVGDVMFLFTDFILLF